jgi:uncharacterized protein YbjT (DUF2867 family)
VRKILLTGATGYIGGRLLPRLLEQRLSVRVLVREPAHATGRAWTDHVRLFAGDVRDRDALRSAVDGVDAAYYLIQPPAGPDYAARARDAAYAFADAARHVPHSSIWARSCRRRDPYRSTWPAAPKSAPSCRRACR